MTKYNDIDIRKVEMISALEVGGIYRKKVGHVGGGWDIWEVGG